MSAEYQQHRLDASWLAVLLSLAGAYGAILLLNGAPPIFGRTGGEGRYYFGQLMLAMGGLLFPLAGILIVWVAQLARRQQYEKPRRDFIVGVCIITAVQVTASGLRDESPREKQVSGLTYGHTRNAGSSEPLPTEAMLQLGGKVSVSTDGLLTGTLYNGTSSWTIESVMVELRDHENRFMRFDNDGKNQWRHEKYRINVEIPPYSSKQISLTVNWTRGEHMWWSMLEAQGKRTH